jgi:hypothetical protein
MATSEQVQALITPVEPLTGDKRIREDGVMDEGPSLAPASRNNSNNFGNNPAPFQQQQQSMVNGNFMQSMMVGGRLQQMQNNGEPSIPVHDALYIGDLQWVRLLCRLLPTCVHLSKLFFFLFRLFPLLVLVDN